MFFFVLCEINLGTENRHFKVKATLNQVTIVGFFCLLSAQVCACFLSRDSSTMFGVLFLFLTNILLYALFDSYVSINGFFFQMKPGSRQHFSSIKGNCKFFVHL